MVSGLLFGATTHEARVDNCNRVGAWGTSRGRTHTVTVCLVLLCLSISTAKHSFPAWDEPLEDRSAILLACRLVLLLESDRAILRAEALVNIMGGGADSP